MTTMWLATTTGAVLFFVAGYLARLIMRGSSAGAVRGALTVAMPVAAIEPPVSVEVLADRDRWQSEHRRVQNEHDRLRADHAKVIAERDRLRNEHQQVIAERDRLRADHARTKADHAKLTAERDRLRADHAKATAERDRLRADHATTKSDHAKVIAERDHLRAEQTRAHAAGETQLAAHADLERDLAEAASARRTLEEALDAAQSERLSLVTEVERLRGELAATPDLIAEVDALRAHAANHDRLASRVASLEAELSHLRALELCAAEPPTISEPAPNLSATSTTATALEGILARVAANADTRAAVIADELGLPIVALGEHASSLAALGSIVGDAGQRARALLPMGAIRGFSIADENSATITSWPITAADATLMILTLTVGPGPADETLRLAALEAASAVA